MFLAALTALGGEGFAQTLRVAAYNIAEDLSGSTGSPGSDLGTVLKGIGDEHLAGHSQPIDVLALEELYQNPSTILNNICTQLNNIYGAGTYTYDTTVDPTTDPTLTGNGPSGLIYNTKTVQLLGVEIVGSASSNGAPRAPMRYTLAPKGYNDHSADFTLYVSHAKSGTPGTGPGSNGDRRNKEMQELRDDAYALNDSLNGNTSNEVAHVIYAGDFNLNTSGEDAYQTMISSSPTEYSGIMKGNDTLNPANNWMTTNAFQALFTESSTNDEFRDDFQFVTDPMLTQAGMQLIAGTLTAFGNGGNIYHKSVTSSSNSNALTDLSNRSAVLSALTTASDHLPIVADYSFATAVGAPGDFDHSGVVDSADYALWRSTYGMTGSNLLADANHNGVVDDGDYLIWRRFHSSGSGTEFLGGDGSIPEPAAWCLFVCGCLAYPQRIRLKAWNRLS